LAGHQFKVRALPYRAFCKVDRWANDFIVNPIKSATMLGCEKMQPKLLGYAATLEASTIAY
jgi:hypothetical protein